MKKAKLRPLTESELGMYMKGYGDASVGNSKAYSRKDLKRGAVLN